MVEVRFALPTEREAVALFMRDAFPRAKWALSGWQTLLSGRWSGPDGHFAIVAHNGEEIVGVLGLVTSHRPTAHGPCRFANMTSWYVLKPYRGQGLGHQMIALACALPETIVTNFTSSANAVGVVTSAGLSVLDDTRCVWHPRGGGNRLPVYKGAEHPDLPGWSRQVWADHSGLRLTPWMVETEDGPVMLLISEQKRSDDYAHWEIYHISDPARFAAHDRAIANSILPTSGAVLSADTRLVASARGMDVTEPLNVPRFYAAGILPPAAVDPLYSEVILLDMKLS